jgi:predicted neuraminidase
MRRGLALAGAVALGTFAALAAGAAQRTPRGSERPLLTSELIFPLDALHNHGSCIVECPNGDLLVCWYRGSGERRADDVVVLGARRDRRSGRWSEPFLMADVPGFPDCNPCMVVDPRKRLWLFWPVIIANEWHTALLMSKVSEDYMRAGPPVWSREKPIILKPGEEFVRDVEESVEADLKRVETLPAERREAARKYLETRREQARDKYSRRMGWMPRVHPIILDGQRMVLPLYSDGFDFSLMAITDDWGETWQASRPLIGDGPVQPSVVRKRDGTLAAYMRDNGGPPKRLLYSESADRGMTWSAVRDTDILNPGAGAEVIALRNGNWALINNDTERGRHRLAVSISEDDGKTWPWTRYLEQDAPEEGGARFAYPSLIQAADGSLHATYTYTEREGDVRRDAQGRRLRESIKYARFNEAWVRQGDGK